MAGNSAKTYAEQAPGATGVDPDHPLRARFRVVDREAGIIEPLDGVWRKKIAICGFAASSRMLAPFADPDTYICGLNQLYRHIPRADMWWDIHENFASDNVEGTDHPGYLRECGMPIFMTQAQADIPTSVTYPLQRVTERVVGTDYFTSTVAFMVAWAIMNIDEQVDAEVEALVQRAHGTEGNGDHGDESAKKLLLGGSTFRTWLADRYAEREIGIFGIDLIVGTEYDWQKSCVEYILGLANARGITVRIPPQSALLKQRWRYGYETEPQGGLIKGTELAKRGAALSNERNQLIARLQTIDGASQELQYWAQIYDLRSKGGSVKLNEDS